jgi:glycosyltransferase involved in cell wall biosynthesis
LKILMLSDYFPPHIGGGVEKAVYELSRRLAGKGIEVVVVTLNTEGAEGFEVIEGIRVYRCMTLNLTGAIGAQLSISPSVPFRIVDVCRSEKPDIVHANNRFFFTTLCATALKRLINRPLVTTFHLGPVSFERGSLNAATRAYEGTACKLIVGLSDKIIAVSKAVRDQALLLGAEPGTVAVIPNGVDLCEFKPGGEGPLMGPKRIACVGRLVPNKGTQFLVEAAPLILASHPDVEFVIVGEGPLKEHLVHMAERLGVRHAFQFRGTVHSVADVLRGCYLLVRPSLTEGMPLTVLEAMACGLPVVASRVSGTPEVVLDGETGLLVEAGNVGQLAQAIKRLLGDESYAMKIGQNALRLVKAHYSWDNTAELTRKVYEDVLSSR